MRFVPNAVTRSVGRQLLVGQKNAPTLLFGAGVLGMVGATVLACRATLKMQEVVDEVNHDLHAPKNSDDPNYTESERNKDKALVFGRSSVKVARLYGPSILLGAASITMLAKSHSILQKRNAALTAAYVAVDEAYRRYRRRVRERYGEEVDRELLYSNEDVDHLDDRGKLTTVKQVDPEAPSQYARFFDQTSGEWQTEPEYNLVFLQGHQAYFNNRLIARGHVFLNEVYDALGMERTRAGSVVGWVVSADGDNYIDFGMYNSDDERKRAFVNGREGAILLDFNVDGIIYDKIDDPRPSQWQS